MLYETKRERTPFTARKTHKSRGANVACVTVQQYFCSLVCRSVTSTVFWPDTYGLYPIPVRVCGESFLIPFRQYIHTQEKYTQVCRRNDTSGRKCCLFYVTIQYIFVAFYRPASSSKYARMFNSNSIYVRTYIRALVVSLPSKSIQCPPRPAKKVLHFVSNTLE